MYCGSKQQSNSNKHGSRTIAKVTIIYLFIHYRLFTGMCLEKTMSLGYRGPGSIVGIGTGYGLGGPGIESRWGARFSAIVQNGPGAHPASCTMGTGSFPGVKSGRGVTMTPYPLLVVMKE
jgi:hypothetical protein